MDSHGGAYRVRAAHFPEHKTLEEFDSHHQRSVKRDVVAHLGALQFAAANENFIQKSPGRGVERGTRLELATLTLATCRGLRAISGFRLAASPGSDPHPCEIETRVEVRMQFADPQTAGLIGRREGAVTPSPLLREAANPTSPGARVRDS